MLKYKGNVEVEDIDEYDLYIERVLDEADEEAKNPNTKYYTHEELFEKIRRKINDTKI